MLFPKYILRRIINDVIKDGFPRICIIVRLSTFFFIIIQRLKNGNFSSVSKLLLWNKVTKFPIYAR